VLLGNFEVEDHFTQNSQFPKIVARSSAKMRPEMKGKELLALEVEQNPIGKPVDLILRMEMMPLDLVLNRPFLEKIAKFFAPPENLQVKELQQKTAENFKELSALTQAQLEDSLKAHKILDIHLQIQVTPNHTPPFTSSPTCSTLFFFTGAKCHRPEGRDRSRFVAVDSRLG
jgi:hypothetical protein